MNCLTNDLKTEFDEKFLKRKQQILQAENQITVTGKSYYVSDEGDDQNSGLSPQTPWSSLKKVSEAVLMPGDGVFFRRGSLFRGCIKTQPGVTYAAYGKGEKPKLYGSELSLADPGLWEPYICNIWTCKRKLLDVGTLVFNGEQQNSRKLIPSYKNGKFVCREDESRDFAVEDEMTQNLDLFWEFDEVLTTRPSRGESFPIPDVWNGGYGTLYLRCDEGNPGEIFEQIEALSAVDMFKVLNNKNVSIDNLCIKYVGRHGVSAGGFSKGLTVSNCEFGWIGGAIQNYEGTDPNYPEGGRGTVTRYGNAIEVYGGCDNYKALNNYIYEVYDAGITHQVTTNKRLTMTNIEYSGNVIEKCVYGIEYFLDQIENESESYMDNVVINDNFIRLSGYGWGQQRHNTNTPAAIKGWSYINTAKSFTVSNNIFDHCQYRLLHLVALKDEYCPKMNSNTYIQNESGILGQYGGNEIAEPENLPFCENYITDVFGDMNATVVIEKE